MYLTLVSAGGAAWEVMEALGGRTFGGSGTLWVGLRLLKPSPAFFHAVFWSVKCEQVISCSCHQAHEPLPLFAMSLPPGWTVNSQTKNENKPLFP